MVFQSHKLQACSKRAFSSIGRRQQDRESRYGWKSGWKCCANNNIYPDGGSPWSRGFIIIIVVRHERALVNFTHTMCSICGRSSCRRGTRVPAFGIGRKNHTHIRLWSGARLDQGPRSLLLHAREWWAFGSSPFHALCCAGE